MAKDKLNEIFRLQRELQAALGYDFDRMTMRARIQYILTMSYALEDEVHESTKEVGWKPWAKSRHINEDAYRSELIDAFFFLLNLMMAAGMKPLDLWRGFLKKLKVNHDRAKNGYDGVSTKCPVCKRDFGDTGVECSPGVHVQDYQRTPHAKSIRVPRRSNNARRALRSDDAGKSRSLV